MLRSIRYGEADRILHLYTVDHGRVGAIAKGIRKTSSRVGGRLEPLGHVELLLHQGRGELHTVTGVELIRPHSAVRDDPCRLAVGLIGAEAMLRLFTEQEANERAFTALTRFLDLLDDAPQGRRRRPGLSAGRRRLCRRRIQPRRRRRPVFRPGVAGFAGDASSHGASPGSRPARALVPAQAALAVRLPSARGQLCRVRLRRAARRLLGAGGRNSLRGVRPGALALSSDGLAGMEALLRSPLADARATGLTERGAREVLAVITSSYEEHGGFRLRTLRAG